MGALSLDIDLKRMIMSTAQLKIFLTIACSCGSVLPKL
jgi:hypothetical protein